MDRGSSDEAIVGVKSIADEDAVTYLRIKLSKSDRDVGAEGRNMFTRRELMMWLYGIQP